MDKVHSSWYALFNQYDINLDMIYNNTSIVYPAKELIFNVFQLDVKLIKIVLLGQDPYYKKGQAHGLSFSICNDQPIPPSLRNIFKELKLEFPERSYEFTNGDLTNWLNREHIFLLNSALSVEANKPASHLKIWEEFTDDIIKYIYEINSDCVFLLLGNYAKKKDRFILNKQKIIYGIHPSPLARGFIGSNIFKQVEEKLNRKINWSI
jgi:uracil-DNA glycosylase